MWALENAIHNNPDKDFNGSVLASDASYSMTVLMAADAGVQQQLFNRVVRDQDSGDLCNENILWYLK